MTMAILYLIMSKMYDFLHKKIYALFDKKWTHDIGFSDFTFSLKDALKLQTFQNIYKETSNNRV